MRFSALPFPFCVVPISQLGEGEETTVLTIHEVFEQWWRVRTWKITANLRSVSDQGETSISFESGEFSQHSEFVGEGQGYTTPPGNEEEVAMLGQVEGYPSTLSTRSAQARFGPSPVTYGDVTATMDAVFFESGSGGRIYYDSASDLWHCHHAVTLSVAQENREDEPDPFTLASGVWVFGAGDGNDSGSELSMEMMGRRYAGKRISDGGKPFVVTGKIVVTPESFWEWKKSDGTQPIWDKNTGAQLLNPSNPVPSE